MKIKKYTIPYLTVLICFLVAVFCSNPSEKNKLINQGAGSTLIYRVGNERPVLNDAQGIAIVKTTSHREVISIPNKGAQTEFCDLYATACLVKIEEVLYGNLKKGSYVYVLQPEHPSVEYRNIPDNGGVYPANEQMVIFLTDTHYDHNWMEQVGFPMKLNYPVFIPSNGGYADRIIRDNGQLSFKNGIEIKDAAFAQFRTLKEMRTFLSEFDLEKANRDFIDAHNDTDEEKRAYFQLNGAEAYCRRYFPDDVALQEYYCTMTGQKDMQKWFMEQVPSQYFDKVDTK
jgi:hypothetical protein